MASRFAGRLLTALAALVAVLTPLPARRKPLAPRRILVLHHLLLGDTLMLTALLKKLRERYPEAEIVMTCSRAFVGLYAARPYGVEVVAFHERDVRTLLALLRRPRFDLTIIPAENRLSLLARAIRSRWIVGLRGDRPAYKNWFLDELHPFPDTPMAWGEVASGLVDGPPPAVYDPTEWPAPPHAPFDRPTGAYCVLHVGASTPLKFWEPEKWRGLADALAARGLEVVLSAGPGEAPVVDAVDPQRHWRRYPGNLALPQLWALLANAHLVVCPDTGVAHLARVVDTPVVVLYGGGSSLLFGGGAFWRNARERKLTVPAFPCRDQNIVFRRPVAWAGTCARTLNKCADPKCMRGLSLEAVREAALSLQLVAGSDPKRVSLAQ